MVTFDLRKDGWIPVLDGDTWRLVGIREAFAKGDELQLACADPLEEVVIVRLLGEVVRGAAGGCVTEASPSYERISRYLTRYPLYFIHPTHPFYQIWDLTCNTSWITLHPSKNSMDTRVVHDHSRVDRPPPLTEDEAVRLHLQAQSFAPTALRRGGYGYTVNGPLLNLVVTHVLGPNLTSTIFANSPR